MLKSCSYCGSIHERNYKCSEKPNRNYKVTHVDKFRWTKAWQNKRKYIREDRDKHLCQICIRELYNTQIKYNFTDIQVHHIVPIAEDYSKRLDDNCLLSLCSYHHRMAEDGEISRDELLEIVKEQEAKLEPL
jgi:5-methylcytosine-specific restriction protein A